MAVGSGGRDVSRRRGAGVPHTADTPTAASDFRHVVYEHAGRSEQLFDARCVTETGRGHEWHEWIVLTWCEPPTKGPFSRGVASSSLRARFPLCWSLSTGAH